MKREGKTNVLLAIGILSLSGCAGYDRILFATKTNVGLDIDDKPPTAEITIARRELAITPAFQDAADEEKTLPLLASFGLTGNFLNPEITSRFAGGEAALALAKGPKGTQANGDSSLCLSKEPDTKPLWKKIWPFSLLAREDTRAFYFATDTAFGLKAAWDGVTGPYPSTLKLGYNRRELAFPPVFATPVNACPDSSTPVSPPPDPSNDSEHKGPWKVSVPSFVVALDNSSTLKERFESGVTHIQFFATGQAASDFVKRPEVNEAMNRTMYRRNDLFVTPETASVMVGSKQVFTTAGGKGPVRLTLLHDPAIAGPFVPSTGEYTAGTIPGTYAIGAADLVGNTAIAIVTVYPQLAITPTSQNVAQGKTLQFTATGGVPPLNFSISQNRSGGSIDEKGLYTAGNTGNMTDKVKITDSSSPPISVETTVDVQ